MTASADAPNKRSKLKLLLGGLAGLFLLCVICTVIGSLADGGMNNEAETRLAVSTATPEAISPETTEPPAAAEATGAAPANTPEPTATTAPNATPEPTVTPEPAPDPIIFEGASADFTDDFSTTSPLLVVDAKHSGGANFIVTLKDASSGDPAELIVNEIGPFDGRMAFQVEPGSYFFDVEADGQWQLTTMLPAHLEMLGAGSSYEFAGTGSDVTPLFPLEDGRVNFEMTHDGAANFIVTIYNVDRGRIGALLANEIGPVERRTTERAGAGRHMIGVQADGNWTLRVSQ